MNVSRECFLEYCCYDNYSVIKHEVTVYLTHVKQQAQKKYKRPLHAKDIHDVA